MSGHASKNSLGGFLGKVVLLAFVGVLIPAALMLRSMTEPSPHDASYAGVDSVAKAEELLAGHLRLPEVPEADIKRFRATLHYTDDTQTELEHVVVNYSFFDLSTLLLQTCESGVPEDALTMDRSEGTVTYTQGASQVSASCTIYYEDGGILRSAWLSTYPMEGAKESDREAALNRLLDYFPFAPANAEG